MTEQFNLIEHPHRRLNILTGEWVLVSPHRSKRPWLGKVEAVPANNRPAYDPACYLCPTNTRVDGSVNPDYKRPYSFTNDHAALIPNTPNGSVNIDNLFQAKSQRGICKVICFSPKHNETLSELSVNEIKAVIDLWQHDFAEIAQNNWIKFIQIFENKGEVMGCSNPHPHCQIWSSEDVPVELEKETKCQLAYYQQHQRSILGDYLAAETENKVRIVYSNEYFVVLVPYWATWPFETMIISKRQVQYITQFTQEEKLAFADALKKLSNGYDALFQTSFPYSSGIHQAPVNDGEHNEWHWHMHFYPPLLRSASVKKFMVGYEMLAGPQRDITPEWAAERLKSLIAD